MNKRGQVYILAAILLGLVLFALVSKVNVLNNELIEDDFEELSSNYQYESTKFVNFITESQLRDPTTYTDQEVSDSVLAFTREFTRFSKTQNSFFGLIYLIDFNNHLYVGNYLNQDILLWVNDEVNRYFILGCQSEVRAEVSFFDFDFTTSLDLGDVGTYAPCSLNLPYSQFQPPPNAGDPYIVNFLVGDIQYSAFLISGKSELGIVSHELRKEQRKVFINQEFISGQETFIESECTEHGDQVNIIDPAENFGESAVCNCAARSTEDECLNLNNLGCDWDDSSETCS